LKILKRLVDLMANYAKKLADEFNEVSGEGIPGTGDAMSLDSDDAGDDSNDVQIVESNRAGMSGIDETCNDRPLSHLDKTFYIDYT
jgi:hypothetical protein